MAAMAKDNSMKGESIRSQMTKFGWEEGKGLGRNEQGMKDAIKVSVKNNKNGLGLDPSETFVFHWWDHVFNKVASSIKIDDKDGEVKISRDNEDKTVQNISSKKPTKAAMNKELLYGRFVRSGTSVVDSKTVKVEKEESSSSDESDDDEKLDFSKKDTLEKAFQLSGGRTGHKAARHGHKLNGKLKRLLDQEESSPMVTPQSSPRRSDYEESQELILGNYEPSGDPVCSKNDDLHKKKKKSKKEKKKIAENNSLKETAVSSADLKNDTEVADICMAVEKKRKKKSKNKSKHDGGDSQIQIESREGDGRSQKEEEDEIGDVVVSRKRKKSKKSKTEYPDESQKLLKEENGCKDNKTEDRKRKKVPRIVYEHLDDHELVKPVSEVMNESERVSKKSTKRKRKKTCLSNE